MEETQAEALRKSLIPTGERQYGSKQSQIKRNHLVRYAWAAERVEGIVLDAACGIGYGTQMLAQADGVIGAHGLEVNPDVVKLARHYYGSADGPGPGCTFECVELHSWVHAESDCDQWFGAVVSFETIEHLVMPQLFLFSAWDALSDGGKLYFSVPNAEVEEFRLEGNPFHIMHYTEHDAVQLAKDCGFHVDCVWAQVGGVNDSQIVHAEKNNPGRFWVIECTRSHEPGGQYGTRANFQSNLPRAFHEAFIERCRTIRSLRTSV